MSRSKPASGIGGVLFVCCAALAAAGVGADFLIEQDFAVWLGAEDGGPAAIGAGATAFVILAGFVARLVLADRDAPQGQREKRDARTDA